MPTGMIGKKVGMTRVFTENGEQVPVTVIALGPNQVIGLRTQEKDQYTAVRLGFQEAKEKHLNKPLLGEFKKAGTQNVRHIREFRVSAEELANFTVGQELKADTFSKGQFVDVTGSTRGLGFAGVVKKFKVGGMIEGHGTHEYFRHIGAIGQRKSPGRVFKNRKMPGRKGNDRVTTQNLQVVDVDVENNLLLVKGAVPGHKNGLILVRPAVKPRKVAQAPVEPPKKKK